MFDRRERENKRKEKNKKKEKPSYSSYHESFVQRGRLKGSFQASKKYCNETAADSRWSFDKGIRPLVPLWRNTIQFRRYSFPVSDLSYSLNPSRFRSIRVEFISSTNLVRIVR